MDREEFNELCKEFLDRLFGIITGHFSIDIDDLQLDHVCWRCATIYDFEQMEKSLLQMGSMFHKNVHNGRPISLISLDMPIEYLGRTIDLIELPAPKEGTDYLNGFEHAEFVYQKGLDKLQAVYPSLPWITNNQNKLINPDIKLKHKGLSIKFHPYTLAHVAKNLE